MDLIQIPVSPQELSVLVKIIDPQGRKKRLEEDDFINCFIVPEDKKKQKEKEIQMAFKHTAGGSDLIEYSVLEECLLEEGLGEFSTKLVLKQLGDY